MNKKFIKICAFLIIIFIGLFVVRDIFAVDLTVTCVDDGPCSTSPSSGAALFEENKFLPGDSIQRTITAINQDINDDCNLNLDTENEIQTPSDFSSKLFTVIKDGVLDIFGIRDGIDKASNDKTLSDIFNQGAIFLETIPANSTKIFEWVVTFDKITGNAYQGAETSFDFGLNFECGIASLPTNTPTPAPGGGGGGGGTTLGAGVTAPTCNDTAPAGAPILNSAVPGANSVTLFWSEGAGPISYYLIAYGISSENYTFGNPNVGGLGTTSYTVTNLSGGTPYYFVVRAGNGCAPGPFSNELPQTPLGGTVTGSATGFFPGVLGIATPSGELTGSPVPTGEIAGEMVEITPFSPFGKPVSWGIIFALLFAGGILIIFLLFRRLRS